MPSTTARYMILDPEVKRMWGDQGDKKLRLVECVSLLALYNNQDCIFDLPNA